MSFRKRNDVLSATGNTPSDARQRERVRMPNATPLYGRGSTTSSRIPQNTTSLPKIIPNKSNATASQSITRGMGDLSLNNPSKQLRHPGVKPSTVITSQQITSTGCLSLDKYLLHGGIPLGHSLLIEEGAVDSTDFNSVLTRLFSSQSIQYNKIQPKSTHLIVITPNLHYSADLPGLYKSSSKREIKKTKVVENESKLTVQNLLDQKISRQQKEQVKIPAIQEKQENQRNLKIAWRYGLTSDSNNRTNTQHSSDNGQQSTFKDPTAYCQLFDITSRMVPPPTREDITVISPIEKDADTCVQKVRDAISRHKGNLIRIVLPSFLNPVVYPPHFYSLPNITKLLYGLHMILKEHSSNAVLLASLSTILFNENSLVMNLSRQIFSSVVILEPFPQQMLDYLEKCYKAQGQPNKVQHGLFHVLKLPIFSDERSEMLIRTAELCFRNNKKGLDIEEWSIPIDEGETEQKISKPVDISDVDGSTHQHKIKQTLEF
ncbi:related to Elongator complex protein 4 [Saccharomycodes ludwigii]|uniref:Elongator complex protein 4 n=1 Tax=Saccharomycodes ludwigii TaxID=36035 RepID=A0A376B6W2_9ASCO|nr:hypothetical protein SCDLUD_002052 [Saccharomycodes ludwigii]KAH3902235.1 hypothetical protein SCDLUD_002052 [Saccharomycodes ludwigii]SSD60423.1 related to Elongator complex protein 4 [Saccharomycodes ludwigii]